MHIILLLIGLTFWGQKVFCYCNVLQNIEQSIVTEFSSNKFSKNVFEKLDITSVNLSGEWD